MAFCAQELRRLLVTLHEVPEDTADRIKIGTHAMYASKTTRCLTVIWRCF